ncbi:WD repeat-containing protein 25-like [Babylonia areolata]|uniref:WD repeat-containing protein 25-like n=1 Tax=Babylonia areolata TaxID=304850 RepID=UPI003FD0609D
MDQLVAYNSDSEHEDDNHADSDERPQQTLEAHGNDFFGLTSNTSQVTTSDTETRQEETAIRQVHVDGASIEVPEGDFWTNLSEAELTTDCEADHGNAKKRKFESPTRPQNPSEQISVPYSSFAKRQQCGKTLSVHQNTNNARQMFASTTSLNDASCNDSRMLPDSKMKVYEVHPKISPHLNREQSNRCACKLLHRWSAHAGVINRISWCSNPSFSHLIVSASMDSTLRVWNAWGQQRPCVRTLTTHTKAVRDVQWSTDGRCVLSCSYDRSAAVTDVETGQRQVQLEHSGFVSAGRFHPVTPHLVTTGTKDCIQVWDIRDPVVPVRILTHREQFGQVQDLMFSHDGQELFSCGDVVARESADRSIMAWDFRTGVILSNQIFQERYTVTRLCLHPSQSLFVAQTQADYVAVFSTQRPYKMNKNKRFEGHQTASYNIGVSLSQDGSIVYSGSSDAKLYCYNFSTGKKIRTLNCSEILLDVAAHPVLPSVVAGATWDGDIVLFQ